MTEGPSSGPFHKKMLRKIIGYKCDDSNKYHLLMNIQNFYAKGVFIFKSSQFLLYESEHIIKISEMLTNYRKYSSMFWYHRSGELRRESCGIRQSKQHGEASTLNTIKSHLKIVK